MQGLKRERKCSKKGLQENSLLPLNSFFVSLLVLRKFVSSFITEYTVLVRNKSKDNKGFIYINNDCVSLKIYFKVNKVWFNYK